VFILFSKMRNAVHFTVAIATYGGVASF